MRRSKRFALVLASCALAALSGAAWAEKATPTKVRIRGVISPPQVATPVEISVTVYPAVMDNAGNYVKPATGIENRRVYYDPKSKIPPQDFELELELLKEYEVRVEMIDPNGDPVKDRTYYFSDVSDANPESRTPLNLDAPVRVPLPFRWEARSPNKGNFISPVPSGQGYVLTHYINLATVPGT